MICDYALCLLCPLSVRCNKRVSVDSILIFSRDSAVIAREDDQVISTFHDKISNALAKALTKIAKPNKSKGRNSLFTIELIIICRPDFNR
jgi:hypothetical protein